MTDDALARLLARKDRELRLLLAIDDIRDAVDDDDDPRPMLTTLLRLLLETFDASMGGLGLLEETSDDLHHFVTIGIEHDAAVDIFQTALRLTQPSTLKRPAPPHWIGMRMEMKNLPLGAMFLGRSIPFDQDALLLLRIAARQIDSAILQAHTIFKLIQRTRELDAIYRIDHLRDTLKDERAMLHAFASVLLEEYDGHIAVVLTDQMEALASSVVRDDLPPMMPLLRAETASIQFPQIIPMQPGLISKDSVKAPLALLAAPLLVDGERLGAVVVGRIAPFTVGDHRLLYAMTSQIDTAVVHLRLVERLANAEKALASYTQPRLE